MADLLEKSMRDMKISGDKSAVFCFGRFQPPTNDHRKLAVRVMKEARDRNADAWVFSSVSENKSMWRKDESYTKMKDLGIFCSHRANENPIIYKTKLSIMRQLWLDLIEKGLNVYDSKDPEKLIRNVNDIIKYLKFIKGYKKVYLIFGEDRFIKGSFDEFYYTRQVEDFIVILRDDNLISGTKARMGALEIFQPIVGGKILSEFVFDWDNQEDKLIKYAKNYLGYENMDLNIVKNIIESIWNGIADKTNRLDIFKWVNNWNIARTKGQCIRLFDKKVSKGVSQSQLKREITSNRINKPYLRSAVTAVMNKKDNMVMKRALIDKTRTKLSHHDDEISEANLRMKQELISVTRKEKYFADRKAITGYGEEIRVPGIDMNAVMTFGRFQPPHKGHGELIELVHEEGKPYNADGYIFTSNKFDFMQDIDTLMQRDDEKTNRNPLKPDQKIYYLQKLYPKFKHSIATKATYDDIKAWYKHITPFTVCTWLLEQGYTRIIIVVGQDREKDMEGLITHVQDMGGIAILKTKTRDLEGGISGTIVRQMALDGDFESFKNAVQSEHSELNDDELKTFMQTLKKQTDNKYDRLDRHKERSKAAKKSLFGKSRGKKKGGHRKKRTRKKRGGGGKKYLYPFGKGSWFNELIELGLADESMIKYCKCIQDKSSGEIKIIENLHDSKLEDDDILTCQYIDEDDKTTIKSRAKASVGRLYEKFHMVMRGYPENLPERSIPEETPLGIIQDINRLKELKNNPKVKALSHVLWHTPILLPLVSERQEIRYFSAECVRGIKLKEEKLALLRANADVKGWSDFAKKLRHNKGGGGRRKKKTRRRRNKYRIRTRKH